MLTHYSEIRNITKKYQTSWWHFERPLGASLIEEIQNAVENEAIKDDNQEIALQLQTLYSRFWQAIRNDDQKYFYIAHPRSLEAQILFEIARHINVPKEKDKYPNLRTYGILMKVKNTDVFSDLPDDTQEIILTQEGTYLLTLENLLRNLESNQIFINYAKEENNEPLGEDEEKQIFHKNKAAWRKIGPVLKARQEDPGWISLKTMEGLIIIAEITTSKNGVDPNSNRSIKERIRRAIENFPDFAAFMFPGWDSTDDPETLLAYPYHYFNHYLQQLPHKEMEAFKKLKLSISSETLYRRLENVRDHPDENIGCMSMAGRAIAGFVYEVSPSTVFLNEDFKSHSLLWARGSRAFLMGGNVRLFGLPVISHELTGHYPAPGFAWYHFFIPYRIDEQTFPWQRFFVTLLSTLGTALIINALNNLAKYISFYCKWWGFNISRFSWMFMLRHDDDYFPYCMAILWIISIIFFFFPFATIGYSLKLVGFFISALVSSIITYRQIYEINPYLGYAFAIAMGLAYAALIVFAGPLISTLAGSTFVSLFSQIPFLPYISQLLTPIGTWLSTQLIQPILVAIGMSLFESSALAVTTFITTPILLNAMSQFGFDSVKRLFVDPIPVKSVSGEAVQEEVLYSDGEGVGEDPLTMGDQLSSLIETNQSEAAPTEEITFTPPSYRGNPYFLESIRANEISSVLDPDVKVSDPSKGDSFNSKAVKVPRVV